MKQIMGDLPRYRYDSSAPAWSVCLMDLFGPMTCQDDIKKRSRMKVWGVLYTCALSRAIHLDIATDSSTESILHTVRRLMARRGNVRQLVSDPGSQLKGASNEMRKWIQGWNRQELQRFGSEKRLEWKFIAADSQHQNGGAESMVKVAKGVKSFMRALGSSIFTVNELITLLDECSNLVNERPIGIRPNSQTDMEYLSPNSLLLGRSSERIVSGPFQSKDAFSEDPDKIRSRFLKVQRITDQFWVIWRRLYFPTLQIRQKWHHAKRNLQIGDICNLRDSNSLRGEWKLCKVIGVHPDRNGVVRNVDVEVPAKYDGLKEYGYQKPSVLTRHVSNLVVLLPVDEDSSC